MDQHLKPTTVLLILLFFGALLGAKFWAGQQALMVPHLGRMHPHPDGRIFVQLGVELYAFDSEDGPGERFDLNEIGIAEMVGDFAFFNNGDLLIRKGPYDPGLLENLRRFFRLSNRQPEIADGDEVGLFRCRLETAQCEPFGPRMLNLNSAFHLTLDPATQWVFLADTSRHRLLLFAPDGEELDRFAQGLKFPNQILFRDGHLYVANTNHHALSSIEITESGFGRKEQDIPVDPAPARTAGQTWPMSMLLHDGLWWVINGDNSLARGGLYLIDDDGAFVRRLELPLDADPMEIVALKEQVLVADFSYDRIYRFDAAGEPLPDFDLPLLTQRLGQLAERRIHYRRLDSVFSWLLIAALGVGFAAAFLQKGSTGAAHSKPTAEARSVNPRNPAIQWIEPDPKLLRQFRVFGWIAVLILSLAVSVLTGTDAWGPEAVALMAALALMVALFYGLYRWLGGMRVGVLGDFLILRDWRGRHAVGKGEHIGYSDQHLLIGDLILPLALQNQSIFPKEELVQQVYPVMRQGHFISRGQVQLQLMKNSPWMTIPLVFFILLAVGVAMFVPGML